MSYFYAIYFAAFVALAVAVWVCPKPEDSFPWTKHLPFLLWFAVIHAIDKLVVFALWRQGPLPTLELAHAILLPASFVALLHFGVQVAADRRPAIRLIEPALVLLWAAAVLLADDRMHASHVASRLLLALPGTVLAAWTFLPERGQPLRAGSPSTFGRVSPLVVGLLLYGGCAGLVVPPGPTFPATILDSDVFGATVGLPVQIFRAFAAVVIAAGVISATTLLRHVSITDLSDSEARYRTLFERSPVGVAVVQDGAIVHVNRRGLEMLGAKEEEELLGTEFQSLFDRPSRPSLDDHLVAHENGRRPGPTDVRMHRLDDEPVDVTIGTAPMVYLGKPAVQVVFEDVGERKAQEAELERYRASLEDLVSKRTAHLEEALAKVKTLHGLLPICAWCRRMRDDDGYWAQIEEYLASHTDAKITHGICPSCAEKMKRETSDHPPRG